MKIEILKEHLEEASQIIARISNKNLSLPVLQCAVLSASPERTILKGTNLDISVEVQLKAKVLERGVVAVPAYVFNQSVNTAFDQKIILESDDTTLHFIGSHSDSKLKILDASEFPTLPYVKEGEGFSYTLPTKELVRALKNVSFAVSTAALRPELASVYMKIQNNTLTTAATDSFRLAEMNIQTKSKESVDPILIPGRNIQEIIKVVSSGDTVEMRVGENQITFVSGGNYITSRLTEGAFPEYSAIIPKTFTGSATMLTEDVVKTLRRVSVFTDATGQVSVSVSQKGKKVLIRAANTLVGETAEEIDAAVDGEDSTLSFNCKYLLDSLSIVSSDSVCFKFSGPGKPLIVSEVPDRGFTYLVMPMNV